MLLLCGESPCCTNFIVYDETPGFVPVIIPLQHIVESRYSTVKNRGKTPIILRV